MFETSTNWLNGAGQVLVYALVIGLGLWVMSKIEVKEKATTCEMCGETKEGGNAWGGWCHDCDNYFEGVTKC